jgi:pimeloyl-ACP methyl ester carboxylesterase
MTSFLKKILLVAATISAPIFLVSCANTEKASSTTSPGLYADSAPLDLRISQWPYPYPLKEFKTSLQGQPASMMYMDVAALGKQKGVVVLFHGKNFSSDYWSFTIAGLSKAGYRVIAPDQIGSNRSELSPLSAKLFPKLATCL